MNHAWHNLLARNTLFELIDGTMIYCLMCESETSQESVSKHISSPLHLSHLEWFTLIYHMCGNNLKCNICNKIIIWDMIKLHALSHVEIKQLMHTENKGKYRTLFENRTIEIKDTFHCCICDINFFTSNDVRAHFNDLNHKNNRDKTPFDENFVSRFPASFKFLITEGLYMPDKENVKCKICNFQSVALYGINRHIESSQHISNKLNLQLQSKKDTIKDSKTTSRENIKENLAEVKVSSENDRKEKLIKQVSVNLDYMIVHSNSELYCVLCECELSESMKSVHKMKLSHVNAHVRYGCNDIKRERYGNYYCENCNCSITCVYNVYQHIKGKKHLNAVDKNKINALVTGTNVTLKEYKENGIVPCIYLVKLENLDVLCKICNCVLTPSIENQISHVSGKSHKKSLKIYGRDRIVRRGNDNYYCECCDIYMNDVEKVFSHIEDKSHRNSFTVTEMRESKMKSTTNISVNSPISEYHDEQRDQENQIKIYGWDNITSIGDRYHCSCCDCNIFGCVNVNQHVRGKNHLQKACASVADERTALQKERLLNINTEAATQAYGNQTSVPLKINTEPAPQMYKGQPSVPLKINTESPQVTKWQPFVPFKNNTEFAPQVDKVQPSVPLKVNTEPVPQVTKWQPFVPLNMNTKLSPQMDKRLPLLPLKINTKSEPQVDKKQQSPQNGNVAVMLLQALQKKRTTINKAPGASQAMPSKTDEMSRLLDHCAANGS